MFARGVGLRCTNFDQNVIWPRNSHSKRHCSEIYVSTNKKCGSVLVSGLNQQREAAT